MSKTSEIRGLIADLASVFPPKTFELTLVEQGDIFNTLKTVAKLKRDDAGAESDYQDVAYADELDTLANKFLP